MASVAEIQAKVGKTVTNMDRLDLFVNGDIDTIVETDNGPVDSVARLAKASLESASGSATQAEAETGTDNTKRMTPLRTRQATLAYASAIVNAVAPVASLIEAQGGSDNVKRMTAARVRDAIVHFTTPVSIRHFGAVGDGVTDDTAAVQAMVDYINNRPVGCAIGLGRGRYKVVGVTLVITKAVTFVGEGAGASAFVLYDNARITCDGNRTTQPVFAFEKVGILTSGIHTSSPLKVDYSPHIDGLLSPTFMMTDCLVAGLTSTDGFVNGIEMVDCPWPKLRNLVIIGDYGTSGGYVSQKGILYTGKDGSPTFEGVRAYSVADGIFAQGEQEGYVVQGCEFVSCMRGFTAKDTTDGLQPLCVISNSHFNCEESAIVLVGITEFDIYGNDIYCQGSRGTTTEATMIDVTPITVSTGENVNVCSGAIHGNAFNGDAGFAPTRTAVRIRGSTAGIEKYRIYGNHYQGLSVGRQFDAGVNGVQVDEVAETFINVVTRFIDNGNGNSRQVRTVAGSTVGTTTSSGRVAILYGASAAFTVPPIPVVCGGDGVGGETFTAVDGSRTTLGCSVQVARNGDVSPAGQTFRINWIAAGV